MNNITYKNTTVCYMCSAECGLVVKHMDGNLNIKGNKDHPVNNGKICPKAHLSESLLTSKDRLFSPLKRIGERGENKFVEISWKQAFKEIASKLDLIKKKSGAESTTFLFGEKPDHDPFYLFAQCYGTPNILDHNSLCDSNSRIANSFVFGDDQERPLPDLQRPLLTSEGIRFKHDCKLIIIFGANPVESKRFYWLWDGILEAQKQGMKLIVVDPVKTRSAKHADKWIQIVPGSDAAIALAMLRYIIEKNIIEEGTIDLAFIKRYTNGWDKLAEEIITDELDNNDKIFYTIEWASEKTDVGEETIIELAEMFCQIKPAVIFAGMNGVAHHYNGLLSSWAFSVLHVITGNIDVPGGLHLRNNILGDIRYRLGKIKPDLMFKHKDIYAGHPYAKHGIVAKIPSDILTGVNLISGPYSGNKYSTKAVFVVHHNPILTAPDGNAWIKAFTDKDKSDNYQLELLVVNDIFLHDTACYADYVLPIAHYLERQGIVENETLSPTLSIREIIIRGKVKSPLEIVQCLAQNMNDIDSYDELFKFKSDDEWCNKVLLNAGCNKKIEQIRQINGIYTIPANYHKYIKKGFSTSSNRIELYQETINIREYFTEKISLSTPIDDKPKMTNNTTTPNNNVYFHLITGRSIYHSHSLTQNLELFDKQTSPVFRMNKNDCFNLDIISGKKIKVISSAGEVVFGVVIADEGIKEGVILGQYGWGSESPFLSRKISNNYNINKLMSIDNFNPISGNYGYGDMKVLIQSVDNHIKGFK